MVEELKHLSVDEQGLIYEAPILVSILIAGADNKIDNKEISAALKVAERNSNEVQALLSDYFKEINESFEELLMQQIQDLPNEVLDRNTVIESRLEQINEVLPKIDKVFGVVFYNTLKDIAKEVAKASGGFLGIMAIGKEERKYINLPMIEDPIKLFSY